MVTQQLTSIKTPIQTFVYDMNCNINNINLYVYMSINIYYPLVNKYIAIENDHL